MWPSLFLPKTRRRPHGSSRPLPHPAARESLLSSLYKDSPAQMSAARRSGRHSPDQTSQDEDVESEDGSPQDERAPLLPIFSAAHLDSLPVYTLTHAIRLLIVQRCETTLSWEQLRSPQVSAFLVKPIQQKIRSSHFSRATLYALIANSLQFVKEGQLEPGNAGVSKTQSMLSELLATRLLKEYSGRELIDALSYDFDPLQGYRVATGNASANVTTLTLNRDPRLRASTARTSTLEVAIRAQAKRFLAHPLVVRHLEAIWAGSIVFHSAHDNLHRYPVRPPVNRTRRYGTTRAKSDGGESIAVPQPVGEMIRRAVTLYNLNDASPLKLSRLRVPRYRVFFSSISYAIMLILYIAVLAQRPHHISALEVVFWFWGGGFMLDEIIGFTEQGFGLYIMSVWNAFDIGILLLFMLYYLLRLFGLLVTEDSKHRITHAAYDVLASTAVLLFPRLFVLLDHVRYFSQLLIAFRAMAQDLVAVLALVAISCSGFFIAFVFSLGGDETSSQTAYSLFQILLGFTPAVWDQWNNLNVMGKLIISMFMIISHFLVLTILVTVLTNSFMEIVRNAHDEHQFLFAVNTISSVKSEALFSYIPPSNVIGWAFTPLRYVVPFRTYIRLNRTVIKATHFPVLFLIFAYERLCLLRNTKDLLPYGDSGEQVGRGPSAQRRHRDDTPEMFSPGPKMKEPSGVTFQKNQALEDVFKLPFGGHAAGRLQDNDKADSVVDEWMTGVTREGGAIPPVEQPKSVVDMLENRRPRPARSQSSVSFAWKRRAYSSTSHSVFSDHEERHTRNQWKRPVPISEESDVLDMSMDEAPAHDEDADDEGVPEAKDPQRDISSFVNAFGLKPETKNSQLIKDDPSTPKASKYFLGGTLVKPSITEKPPPGGLAKSFSSPIRGQHRRNESSNTVVFKPLKKERSTTSSPPKQPSVAPVKRRPSAPINIGSFGRNRVQSLSVEGSPSEVRAGNFLQRANRSTTNIANYIGYDMTSDMGDVTQPNAYGAALNPDEHGMTLPVGSFSTQVAYMTNAMRQRQRRREEESKMMSRMVLARMNTLEEGFKDILKEVKDLKNTSARSTSDESGATVLGNRKISRKVQKMAQRLDEQYQKSLRGNDENDGVEDRHGRKAQVTKPQAGTVSTNVSNENHERRANDGTNGAVTRQTEARS